MITKGLFFLIAVILVGCAAGDSKEWPKPRLIEGWTYNEEFDRQHSFRNQLHLEKNGWSEDFNWRLCNDAGNFLPASNRLLWNRRSVHPKHFRFPCSPRGYSWSSRFCSQRGEKSKGKEVLVVVFRR